MNIKPLNKKILISFITGREKSEGGIILPEKSQGFSDRGKVVSVSKQIDPEIKIGTTVLFEKNGDLLQSNNQFMFINESQIIGILTT